MLSVRDIQSIINPYKNTMPVDDFRLLNTWAEYKNEPGKSVNDRTLDYLCYEMETINPSTGEKLHVFKAIKFVRITRLPKGAKQSTSLMTMHSQLLSGIYSEQMNFITVIANMINPPLGLLFLYGVQGVADNIEDARQIANSNFYGLTSMLQGTYRVLGFSELRAEESEWLREKMFAMDYITVVRGIPKASESGEDGGNKGMGGKNVNPDSQGTLEELIAGMSDYEYVLQVLSTPVALNTLRGWLNQTEKEMTIWYDQLQGTKSLSFNISIPMMFMASNSATSGTSQAYTNADTVSYSQGESYNTSYGENVGQSLSETFGQSYGVSHGTSVTDSISQSHSISQGTSIGESFGQTVGQSYGTSVGQNVGQSFDTSYGQSVGSSTGQSSGQSVGQSYGESLGSSTGQSYGVSSGQSLGQSYGESLGSSTGQSYGTSSGQTFGTSQGLSYGQSNGLTFGQSAGSSIGHSQGTTLGQSIGESYGLSHNVGQSTNVTQGQSTSYSAGQSVSNTHGVSQNTSYNVGMNEGSSSNHSIGNSQNTSYGSSENWGNSQQNGYSNSVSQNHGNTYSQGYTDSTTHSDSTSSSQGNSYNFGNSFGQSYNRTDGVTQTNGFSMSSGSNGNAGLNLGVVNLGGGGSSSSGMSGSVSDSSSDSFGSNSSVSNSYGQSSSYGTSASDGYSHGSSQTFGGSDSVGQSQSNSYSAGSSYGYGLSQSNSFGSNESYSTGYSQGRSQSWGASTGVNDSQSFSQNINHGWGQSLSYSNGVSESYGQSHGVNSSQSYSQSASDSYSQNFSNSMSQSSSNSMSQSMSSSESQSLSSSESQSFSNSASQSMSNSASQSMSNSASQSLSNSASQSLGNSASQSLSNSASQSLSDSQSIRMSDTLSNSTSQSQTQSYSQSQTQSYSQSQSESYGVSQGKSLGTSDSQSYTENASQGSSNSWGQSSSVGQGASTGTSQGKSIGESMGITQSLAQGMSASMGVSPSLGYNRSHQWLDQQVQDIIEMLQFQDDRIKKSLRGNGAFFTYVYFACSSMDSLSAAKAIAKSTWQNEFAMTNPLQVLDLETEEQKHLLYHFSAFSADVTKIDIGGAEAYKYCTVLLPEEFVAYTHLPRISEGGIFAEVNDIPHFAVPSMLKGEIYMGTILSPERNTLKNGYRTPFDYRISEKELMHGFFTGASRSGKTVAAMRFIAELSKVRRSKTGKRLRIVCMDPKNDWRTLARYVEPERFKFYSLGNINFHPLKLNPCKIPRGVQPQLWVDGMIDIFCRAYGLLERGKQMMGETIYALYEQAGVFKVVTNDTNPGWEEEISEKSSHVTFHQIYKKMEAIRDGHEQGIGGRMGNDTRDAYARLLDRLQCFNRKFSIEYQLFGTEEGMSVDELIGNDDVVVLESAGLESTFSNFIFGVITSGFYKEAKSTENGFLNESQYETVLVIEEANKVFTGSDVAGTGSGKSFGMTGQSEFEEMLDQAAGLGLFVFAITQKIAEMPSSIIANSGLVFAGKLKREDDVKVVVRTIAREERYEDRDLVKWFPRSPTGWFVCQSSRTFNFMDAEPILVQIARLNVAPPSNAEIEEILTEKMALSSLKT